MFEKLGKKKEKKTILEKIRDWRKISTFLALLGVLGIENVLAQKPEKVEGFEGKMNKFQTEALASEKTILLQVKENGDSKTNMRMPANEWTAPDSSTIAVGYESQAKEKARWLMYQNKDASVAYFDDFADGTIDKIIINNNQGKESWKRGDNYQFALTMTAEDVGIFDLGDVKIFIVERGEEIGIKALDFKTENSYIVVGSDSENLILNSQKSFTNYLGNVENSIKGAFSDLGDIVK